MNPRWYDTEERSWEEALEENERTWEAQKDVEEFLQFWERKYREGQENSCQLKLPFPETI